MRKSIPLLIIMILVVSLAGYNFLLNQEQSPENGVVQIPPSDIEVEMQELFPRFSFNKPTGIYFHPSFNESIAWVTELNGKIKQVNIETGDNITILNLASKIGSLTDEEGLVGFEFDPEFSANGHVYLHYTTASPLKTYISKFTLNTTSNILGDEIQLLVIDQPYPNHNGGGLAFDEQGLLYIGMGDGGLFYDPHGHGQNRTTLHGNILRIDPTPQDSLNYTIPSDNPFVNNSLGFREEIYAYGMRNPYKISFDQQTGNLWVGDVGQDDREEVDIIEKGKNYGWKIYEGTYCLEKDKCDTIEHAEPVFEYSHEIGNAIIGGLVYRGNSIPELKGTYIFADWLNGDVFTLNPSNITVELLTEVTFLTSSITQDTNQELFFCGFDGSIYRMR